MTLSRVLILGALLFSCHDHKLVPVNHCGEVCAPDGFTLVQLGRGACSPGSWDCTVDGGTCIGAVLPKQEECSPEDLDCNGVVGDVPPRDCTNFCGARSIQYCNHGAWDMCITAPEEFTAPEVCNGRDDNCNGKIDEGIAAMPCYSGDLSDLSSPNVACRYGTKFCANGELTACMGEVLPSKEICDGIDNNCDGTVDENCDLKVTLTWDLYNEDLDLHLGIPIPGWDGGVPETDWFASRQYDCFFGDCVPGAGSFRPQWDDGGFNDPTLNGDDIYYTGPEIITIIQPVPTHSYLVVVHWYDLPGNSQNPTGTVVVTCGATVVYSGSHLFAARGDAWFVGAIDANTDDGGLGCKFTGYDVVVPGEP